MSIKPVYETLNVSFESQKDNLRLQQLARHQIIRMGHWLLNGIQSHSLQFSSCRLRLHMYQKLRKLPRKIIQAKMIMVSYLNRYLKMILLVWECANQLDTIFRWITEICLCEELASFCYCCPTRTRIQTIWQNHTWWDIHQESSGMTKVHDYTISILLFQWKLT